jgi:hypothetical protein
MAHRLIEARRVSSVQQGHDAAGFPVRFERAHAMLPQQRPDGIKH